MSESRIFSSSVESVRPRRRCASPTRLREAAVARLLLALQVLFSVLRALRRGMHRALLLPQAKLAQRVRRADHARDGEVQGGQRRFARQFCLAV